MSDEKNENLVSIDYRILQCLMEALYDMAFHRDMIEMQELDRFRRGGPRSSRTDVTIYDKVLNEFLGNIPGIRIDYSNHEVVIGGKKQRYSSTQISFGEQWNAVKEKIK
jgi:hypothetical protein